MATEKLFAEFPPVTTAEWESVILKDLKGADYQKKLVWQTGEGLAVKPYYRAEDLTSLAHLGGAPGDFPYLRGAQTSNDWKITVLVKAASATQANKTAIEAVAAGAEEVLFAVDKLQSSSDLAALLANLGEIPVRFEAASELQLNLLADWMTEHKAPVKATVEFCPIQGSADLAAKLLAKLPAGLTPFTIDGAKFEECGATAVEQLAFTLSAGIAYLAAMQERGADLEKAVAALCFNFAIGSSYFFEIAKIRAFRALWAQAAAQFGVKAAKAQIFARTSRWNKTLYDPHVNVLRTTTEAMSAVLGGADSVLVDPFDLVYKVPDAASQRLARNTQILLKQEAMLARVADPGAGSYYIEALTGFLTTEAWKRMQQIEALGGFCKAKDSGEIEKALQASLAARNKAVSIRKKVFTGTNQYPNLTEKALDRIDRDHIAKLRRGAESYEKLRLDTEYAAKRSGKTPKFLLAEIGDAKMRAARSGFAANFFGCAGFELTTKRFDSVDEIATAQTDVIVLCSSDPEYLQFTTDLAAKLKSAGKTTPIVIAGAPENAAEITAAGAVDFINVRSNPLESLAAWQKRLGIEG